MTKIFLISSCFFFFFCNPDFVVVTKTAIFWGNLFCQIKKTGKGEKFKRGKVSGLCCSFSLHLQIALSKRGPRDAPAVNFKNSNPIVISQEEIKISRYNQVQHAHGQHQQLRCDAAAAFRMSPRDRHSRSLKLNEVISFLRPARNNK